MTLWNRSTLSKVILLAAYMYNVMQYTEHTFNSLHTEIIYTFSLATRKLTIISVVRTEGQS